VTQSLSFYPFSFGSEVRCYVVVDPHDARAVAHIFSLRTQDCLEVSSAVLKDATLTVFDSKITPNRAPENLSTARSKRQIGACSDSVCQKLTKCHPQVGGGALGALEFSALCTNENHHGKHHILHVTEVISCQHQYHFAHIACAKVVGVLGTPGWQGLEGHFDSIPR
jgi:hypothetical protein